MATSKAMFGAGCFWGVEEAFARLKGVKSTAVGYAGGHTRNPTYQDVCTDRTGHAEVVLVEFDSAEIAYDDLLETFWTIHDPTQVDRQGPDVGTQYRTVIYAFDADQEKVAAASKRRLEGAKRFARPVATKILPAPEFYRAEDYHQRYLAKRGMAVCH